MAHRTILTPKQREVLFGLPADEAQLLKHYMLSDEDLDHIGQRRRPRDRLGFALQRCALRYPGRALLPGKARREGEGEGYRRMRIVAGCGPRVGPVGHVRQTARAERMRTPAKPMSAMKSCDINGIE